ncbi:hypothetical protein quinque_001910 [Culex quinquefasciatus]
MNDPSKTIDFINRELIPGMVERGELTIEGVSNPSEVHLEQVETSPLASDGTFMLTLPFRTKVTLSSGGKGDQRKHREYRLVVKWGPHGLPHLNDEPVLAVLSLIAFAAAAQRHLGPKR